MRRVVIVLVILLIIFACVAAPAVLPGRAGPASGAATSLKRATVDKGDIKLTVSATGSVAPARQSRLGFDQPGRVLEVLVQEGQFVQAGQLLARVDDATQRSNLSQAEYLVQAAEASLQKLLRPVDAGEIAKAEANVKTAQATYSSIASRVSPEQIKVYELQYQQAQTAAQYAEKQRIEAGGRYVQDDPNYQKALAQVGQSQFDAEIARLRVEQARQGSSLEEATANIAYQQTLLAQLKTGPKPADIKSAQNDLTAARLQRDQAQHDLDKTRLVAPFAGVISTLNVKVGEISTGMALVITDTHELYVDVNVDEADIGKILVGQRVDMTFDALTGVGLTGKVQRIAQTADTTASVITYAVRVIPDPATVSLKVGMTANASFLAREAHDVVRVPNEFVRLNRTTRQTTVNLAEPGGTLAEAPVMLGLQGADYTEVIDGLYEGDTVALVIDNAASQ